MSTRGIWGFKLNNEYKVTYNHCDSYPEYLGVHLKNQLINYSIDQLKEIFERIILVNDTDIIPKDIAKEIIDEGFGNERGLNNKHYTNIDYYSFLREWQGEIEPYLKCSRPYMCDGTNYDSFIEYSYIIDLDKEKFITYDGHFTNDKELCSFGLIELRFASDNEYLNLCEYV